ncbi:MAG: 50S ribosomal protein L25 [Spirochaetaceae bacterium]|jgi:large subunit ribosomal protein L25|nr:50S ribosomal protein L25 [Spirochaetaceae bacterium]
MGNVVFKAQSRSAFGSANAGRLRRSGRIPGIIYGKGEAIPIDLDEREFVNGIKGISESTIVKVDVNGASHDAFVKDTQRNIINGSIIHVDFYEIEMGKVLRTHVSVHTFGNPVGVRDGGVLETPLHDIEVECLPKDLPENIRVDISGLGVNQSIHVRDIQLGSGVKLISEADQVVALVKFAKAEAAVAVEAAATTAKPEGDAAADAAKKDEKK